MNNDFKISNNRIVLSKEYVKKKILKVDTIDNFQGREADVIIVDFIRGQSCLVWKGSDPALKTGKRKLDFLQNKERINVAVSRARNKLILVGNFNYFKSKEVSGKVSLLKDYYDILSKYDDSIIEWGEKDE